MRRRREKVFAIVGSSLSLHQRCSKSQLVSRSLFLPPSQSIWLLIPMKCQNIFRQRLPVIRPAQMGYRRRIYLKRQKKTLTERRKRRRSVPLPVPPSLPPLPHHSHHSHHSHHPSIPAGRWGTRAASVPLRFRALFQTAQQNPVFISTHVDLQKL